MQIVNKQKKSVGDRKKSYHGGRGDLTEYGGHIVVFISTWPSLTLNAIGDI